MSVFGSFSPKIKWMVRNDFVIVIVCIKYVILLNILTVLRYWKYAER